jgi:hypothetical protein
LCAADMTEDDVAAEAASSSAFIGVLGAALAAGVAALAGVAAVVYRRRQVAAARVAGAEAADELV